MREEVVLERDVDVTAIPYGDRISLQKGHPVIITQAPSVTFVLLTTVSNEFAPPGTVRCTVTFNEVGASPATSRPHTVTP